MIRKFSFFFLVMLSVCAVSFAQTTVGYSNGTAGRNNLVRFGASEQQGQMLVLGAEKVKFLKGATLTGVSLVVGTKNASDYQVFLRTAPDGENMAQVSNAKPTKANSWLDYQFDAPYTVTGDEPALYVGYTCNAGTYSVLSYDFSQDSREVSMALSEDSWFDTYGQNVGMPNLRLLAEGLTPATDVMVKTYTQQGYYKVGEAYEHSVEFFNFGQTTITGFDALVDMGNGTVERQTVSGLSLAPAGTCRVALPTLNAERSGYQQVAVSVENIATEEGSVMDAETSDNCTQANVFFYPANVQKNLLIEGFTSQLCSNCPAGHRAVAGAVEMLEEEGIGICEVMHHSGYACDIFTMSEDYDYCFFYGSASTYAPAVMVSRWHSNATDKPGPIFNTDATTLMTVARQTMEREPYVQLQMASSYNPATRKVKIRVNIDCLRKPDAKDLSFNILLTQDHLKAYQDLGGTDYEHNAVCRGSLLNNSWGGLLKLEEGESMLYEKEYTLPETIESTLGVQVAYSDEDIAIATVPENMKLVAYVAAFDAEDCNANEVYNCIQIPLVDGGNYVGVESISAPVCRTAERYNLAGQRVGKGYKGIVIENGKKLFLMND